MHKLLIVDQARHIPIWDLMPIEAKVIASQVAEEKYERHMQFSPCPHRSCAWHGKVEQDALVALRLRMRG